MRWRHCDLYEPGTLRARGYLQGISNIYQSDSDIDATTVAQTAIEVFTQDAEFEIDTEFEIDEGFF